MMKTAVKSKRKSTPRKAKPARPESANQKGPPGPARDALLNAALKLLQDKGPGNVSLHDIAAEAGLNVSLVRYYFGSKDKLLDAVIEHLIEDWRAALEAARPKDDSARERLAARIQVTTSHLQKYPFATRLIMQQMMFENIRGTDHFLNSFARVNYEFHRDLLAEGYKNGEFRKVDPQMFFFSYIGISEFFFLATPMREKILGVSEIDERLSRRFIKHITDLIISGISA